MFQWIYHQWVLFRGQHDTNNNTHKHKQYKNKNQYKIKTNDQPKLSIAGWCIFDYLKRILFWVKVKDWTNDNNILNDCDCVFEQYP